MDFEMPTKWLVQDRYRIKGGAVNFRECEHCGDRMYGYIYKLYDINHYDETMFVDEKCTRILT